MSRPTADDLTSVPLFAGLSEEVRAALAARLEYHSVHEGLRIVTEGVGGYELYVVREGTLTVEQHGRHVGTLGPGDVFGEISILGQGRRTATVTADCPGLLLGMYGTSLRELDEEAPDAAALIRSAMEAHLAADEQRE
jgi:CRP-like cAMP-binding protein